MAITIQLPRACEDDKLPWQVGFSDRARAAVLAALVESKTPIGATTSTSLIKRFATYEKFVVDGQMERGQRRLSEVTKAVDDAAAQSLNPPMGGSRAVRDGAAPP